MSDVVNQTFANWRSAMLPPTATIRDAIINLDQVSIQIILVTDQDNRFIGTLSDGDIRRGLLKGLQLESRIESIVHRNPLVVPETLSRELVLQLMYDQYHGDATLKIVIGL